MTRLNAAGTALVYSTYLGGSGEDVGYGVAVDAVANAYVTGYTQSTNFPTTAGVAQTANAGDYDVFVTALNPSGTLPVYSTLLGGSQQDYGVGIAVDNSGNAYVTGYTASSDYPHTSGVLQPGKGSGYDAIVTKLTSFGTIAYSTFLGGSADNYGLAIAVDAAGNAYITGDTASTDFPKTSDAIQTTVNGVFNAFVTRLNATGTALGYSTYVGGSGFETGYGIALDLSGGAYVAGYTVSPDFPVTSGSAQATLAGGSDAFVLKMTQGSATPAPSLSIAKTHAGNLIQGQNGATYTVTVRNAVGAGPTSGTVTVTETVPTGMTLVSMAGTGWTCASNTCTRGDALSAGTSYSAITVTVNVAANALALVTNQVSVSGGGSVGASTTDPTNVAGVCTVTVSPTSLAVAGTAGTLTLTLNGGSCGWTATPNVTWLTPATTSGTSASLNVAVAANTTGAQRTGTLTIVGQTVTVTQAANNPLQIPALVSLNPFQGTGPNATLTLVYAHPSGWAAIQSAEFIINPRWEPNTRPGGCYVKYAPGTGLFTLIADDGNSIAGTAAPGSAGSVSNSQCTLNAASSSVTGNGNTLTVVASLTFQPSFAGQRHIWMQAVDYNNLSTNWLVYGVWFPTQTTVNAIPWYRIYDPFSNSYLYSANPNEYSTLGARGFVLQGISGLVMDGSTTVGGISNMAWYRVYVNVTSSHLWTSDRNEFLTLINRSRRMWGRGWRRL